MLPLYHNIFSISNLYRYLYTNKLKLWTRNITNTIITHRTGRNPAVIIVFIIERINNGFY